MTDSSIVMGTTLSLLRFILQESFANFCSSVSIRNSGDEDVLWLSSCHEAMVEMSSLYWVHASARHTRKPFIYVMFPPCHNPWGRYCYCLHLKVWKQALGGSVGCQGSHHEWFDSCFDWFQSQALNQSLNEAHLVFYSGNWNCKVGIKVLGTSGWALP